MKGLSKLALAMLLVAACGRDSAITEPDAPNAPTRPLLPSTPNGRVVLAIGVDSVTGASIETNKDDYTPGEAVNVVGRGWAAGETVHLFMTEDPDTHADVTMDVQADSAGGFDVVFYGVTPEDLGVTFTLTATGGTSGSVAVATFTDGNVSLASTSPVTGVVSFVVNFGSATCTSTTFTLGTSINFSGASPHVYPECAEVRAPTTVTVSSVTYTFSSWQVTALQAGGQNPISYTTGTVGSSQWLKFVAPGQSTTGAITAQYTAPAVNANPVADAGDPYSGTEGSAIALDGTGSTDSDGTITTYAWTYAVVTADAGAGCTITNPSSANTASINCTDDGSYTVTLTVTDDDGATDDETVSLTVSNALPQVKATGGSGDEGEAINISASFTDAGSNDTHPTKAWSYTAGAGVDGGATCTFGSSSALSTTITCTDDGSYTIKYSVTDDDAGTGEGTATVTVANVAPEVTATGGSGDEGSAINISASFTDDGSNDTHPTKAWSYTAGAGVDAGATCTFGSSSALSTTITCTDDGSYTIKYSVTDDDGDTGEGTATVTVANVAPIVTITSPTVGQLFSLLSGAVPVTATYTDPGSNDTHTCELKLDGDVDVVASGLASGGTCSGSILPTQADVFNLIVTVTDDDGGVGTASVMIVVYDPSAGFVTGGGWINSPAGAYIAYPSLTGKATFGFVSKYKKGATVPEGNTEFQFHAGGLNFHSESYQWLIVNNNGTNAQFKGTGTINGQGNYSFMLWASDNGTSGDTFRIRITEYNNDSVVIYDNGTGNLEQPIANGQIVIHTGSKK